MSHRCHAAEDLAALVGLPADDPRRRDVEACPRCAGLLAEVTAFLAGDPELPSDELARAERHLAASLAACAADAAAGTTTVPAAPPSRRRLADGRWRLGAGLALATAAVLALVALLPPEPTAPSGQVRGGGHVTGAALLGPVTVADTTATGLPAGSLRLDWPAVADADRYQIVLIGAALDTLGTVGPLTAPPAVVDGDLLAAATDGVYARVRALAKGATLAESRLVPLTAR